jgi:hypothetical protein
MLFASRTKILRICCIYTPAAIAPLYNKNPNDEKLSRLPGEHNYTSFG